MRDLTCVLRRGTGLGWTSMDLDGTWNVFRPRRYWPVEQNTVISRYLSWTQSNPKQWNFQENLFIFVKWLEIMTNNGAVGSAEDVTFHNDVIKWKHFPRYWPFVRGIYRSPVNSTHKGQCRRALLFSLTHDWINGWVNNREAGDLRRLRAHYDVVVMRNRIFMHTVLFLSCYR